MNVFSAVNTKKDLRTKNIGKQTVVGPYDLRDAEKIGWINQK